MNLYASITFGKWSAKIDQFKTQSQNAIPQYDISSAKKCKLVPI